MFCVEVLALLNVSLLVRLWVEILLPTIWLFQLLVSLLVRLWVEIYMTFYFVYLKQCQPPCEAVSWNTLYERILSPSHRQPPCEAVSWNINFHFFLYPFFVSLLVRLWVEIQSINNNGIANFVSLLVRLWVEIWLTSLIACVCSVSLLVRLWVEIPLQDK